MTAWNKGMPCPTRNTQAKEDNSIARTNEEQTAMLGALSVWDGIQEDNLQIWDLMDQ